MVPKMTFGAAVGKRTVAVAPVVVPPTPGKGGMAPINPTPPPCTHKRVDLFNSMCEGKEITIMARPDGTYHTGIVNSITREDGSGYSFLVRLHTSPKLIHVRVM
jgi:hypothetical protein